MRLAARKSTSTILLELLAGEHRRVVADWRALLLLRRATLTLPATRRRWDVLPTTTAAITPSLRQMCRQGLLTPLQGLHGVYQVTAPYADSGLADEHEVVLEANPFGALSHHTALVWHGLTDDLPKGVVVSVPRPIPADLLPLGTTSDEWDGLARPPGQRPARLLSQPVRWFQPQSARFFGVAVSERQGYPLRVTDRERTLLDGLLQPDLAGGFQTVLGAWVRARDTLDVATVIQYTDRLAVQVLRQRVGFLLDELGLTHPRLAAWRQRARRGGSNKLHPAAPYTPDGQPHFSAAWNLALNAPIDLLHEEGL